MKKYIVITGGQLFNKGAESMTFITVSNLKERFPKHEIILLSSLDYKRSKKEKDNYKFTILPLYGHLYLANGLYKIAWLAKKKFNKRNLDSNLINNLEEILQNAEMIVDISGYSLSSQRGIGATLTYLVIIKLAQKYKIRMYLMPQSFGPFNYGNTIINTAIKKIIKKHLKYPELIYAREKDGYDILTQELKLTNVKKSYDLVLLNKSFNLDNIYQTIPDFLEFEDAKDIAIIPNAKIFKHGKTNEILETYESIINKLIENDKIVYLIRHSYEDLDYCKAVKKIFKDNERVVLLENELSSIEYNYLVKKFDFIIASRYHSIIHAYKNGTPCIALGWAQKYHELLDSFEQGQYIFDVRTDIEKAEICNALTRMLENYRSEKEVILNNLSKIQESDLFNTIK